MNECSCNRDDCLICEINRLKRKIKRRKGLLKWLEKFVPNVEQ